MELCGGAPAHGGRFEAAAAERALFANDEAMLWGYKIMPCNKNFNHDWSVCPYAHAGEKAKRRCPRQYSYTAMICPDQLHRGSCPRGDACNMTHSVFEYWLHPARYKTKLCRDGASCNRRVCFFAHSLEQLRVPPANSCQAPSSSGGSGGSGGSGSSTCELQLLHSTSSNLSSMASTASSGSVGASLASSLPSPRLGAVATAATNAPLSSSPPAQQQSVVLPAAPGLMGDAAGILSALAAARAEAALATAKAEAVESQLQTCYAALGLGSGALEPSSSCSTGTSGASGLVCFSSSSSSSLSTAAPASAAVTALLSPAGPPAAMLVPSMLSSSLAGPGGAGIGEQPVLLGAATPALPVSLSGLTVDAGASLALGGGLLPPHAAGLIQHALAPVLDVHAGLPAATAAPVLWPGSGLLMPWGDS